MTTEADTCTQYVVPKLRKAGWDQPPHSFVEQRTITDGRIVVIGDRVNRRKQRRTDYLLRFRRDYTIAVVEAKRKQKSPGDGLQQAKQYAEMLGLKFAYSTNGSGIIEYDYLTGKETEMDEFPSPDELWSRLWGELLPETKTRFLEKLLTPYYSTDKFARYYQEIAINRTVQSILKGKNRILLTMATGTGKTFVAFQICWKLWNARWNRTGEHRRPKILYLADRNVLVDDPKDKMFAPFGEARHKIEGGEIVQSREIYFAIYQALARDERRPGLYREFGTDFFDLIIVDECHRGSARDDSNWREILEFFQPAYQLGMTATPKREDNQDTYHYFGNPIYQYSLRQGIEDGFLAPYRVHRVVTEWDAAGWRPSTGELDRFGREIPDEEYQTKDFEKLISLRARTNAIARHLTDFLKQSNRFAKTIVFCVDQEHAEDLRRALNNLNTDLTSSYPDYVCRVTADEAQVGMAHLKRFQDPENRTPVILTTSRLLTTGVDAPTCQNVVLARVINSMTDFKQIIGRGTRVREDWGKLYFNILDYTGSATKLFADPDFDGEPALITEEEIAEDGQTVSGTKTVIQPDPSGNPELMPEAEPTEECSETAIMETFNGESIKDNQEIELPRKYYFDGGWVDIVTHLVHDLDPDGNQLRVVRFTDYTGEKVRTLYPDLTEMRKHWADQDRRSAVKALLEEHGINLAELKLATGHPESDSFDLLCHLAYHAPLLTRRQRVEKLRKGQQDFFDRYNPQALMILEALLEKYAQHGIEEIIVPDALRVPPLDKHGNITEITHLFGGAEALRNTVHELQQRLYAA